jgi:uncharacterized protein DUF4339
MFLLVQLLVALAMAVACSLIANSRGRSAVGWFFVGFFAGCIGLILVLVLPDLKVEQERQRRLADENRRLRERLRKDRIVADERHAEISRRVGAHDVALGVDTSVAAPAALPGYAPDARASAGPDPAVASDLRGSAWYWAQGINRQGPADFDALRSRWQSGEVTTETLVWRKGMPRWTALRDIPGLEETLDA